MLPSQLDSRFHGQARPNSRRQDRIAVFLRLAVKNFPAGQRHNTDAGSFLRQPAAGFQRQGHFRTGGHQDNVRLEDRRLPQDIAAPARAGGGRTDGAIQKRQVLSAEDQRRRPGGVGQRQTPGLQRFVGVRRPDNRHVGNLTKIHDLLDRLMRRTVFAHADAVMRKDKNDAKTH